MTSDMYTGHWTSVDSGRSSAAVFSSQSLAGHDAGVQDPSRLDHLASELELHDAEANHDEPSLKPWLPTMQDLLSPSNSSGSGDNFGHQLARNSTQQSPKRFHVQPDEGPMLQLKLDCNSLKRQNKQLKERCQHYQRLSEQMKSQMKNDASGFYHRLHESLIQKIISAKQNTAEGWQEELQEQLSQLQQENEYLRERNAALERELDVTRDTDWTNASTRKDFMYAYRDELAKHQQMFEQCEKKRQEALEKWREEAHHMMQLDKLTDRLQKELEQVEDQKFTPVIVTSMEQRVKILEESLQKERQDRATGLSAVEERLLLENAKLQISEREAQRRLSQTKNQLKSLESRFSEVRKQLEMKALCDEDLDAIYASVTSSDNQTDKGQDGRLMKRPVSLTDDKDVLLRQMLDMEMVFQQRNHELLVESNLKAAQLLNLHDINNALKAENQSLRSSMKPSQSASSASKLELQAYKDQIEGLKCELNVALDQIDRLTQADRHADALIKILKDIPATCEEPKKMQQHLRQRENIQPTYNMPRSDQQEAKLLKEHPVQQKKKKKKMVDEEKNMDYTELLVHLMRSKMAVTEAEFVHIDESERLTLEGIIEERNSQLLKLNFECDELRTELDFAKKMMSQQVENNEKLLVQVEQLRSQLRQQVRSVECLSATEEDLQMELRAVKQRLAAANKELLEKEAQVKSAQLLYEVVKAGGSQPETERAKWNLAEADDKEFEFEDRIEMAKKSARLIQLQQEKENINESLQKANTTIETLVHENADLKYFLQQFHQQLASERSMVCRLTYDKMAAQQQFFAVDEECDAMKQSKERLEAEVGLRDTNCLRLSALLDSYKQQATVKLDARYNKVNNDLKRVASELHSTKRLLSSREKDILLLQNTVELVLKYDEGSSVR